MGVLQKKQFSRKHNIMQYREKAMTVSYVIRIQPWLFCLFYMIVLIQRFIVVR